MIRTVTFPFGVTAEVGDGVDINVRLLVAVDDAIRVDCSGELFAVLVGDVGGMYGGHWMPYHTGQERQELNRPKAAIWRRVAVLPMI